MVFLTLISNAIWTIPSGLTLGDSLRKLVGIDPPYWGDAFRKHVNMLDV